MCLFVDSKFHKKTIFNRYRPVVLNHDYLVYKVLEENDGYIYTPYQIMPINFADGMADLKKIPFRGNKKQFIKGGGYHAFVKKYMADDCAWHINDLTLVQDRDVFYAVIPKGTKVYFGVEDDIVAERMIIFDKFQTMLNHYNPHRFLKDWTTYIYSNGGDLV